MEFIIKGKVKKGIEKAGKRFIKCRKLLRHHGIDFPPFVLGTLNVELDKEFLTPDWPNVVFISKKDIDEYEAGYGEWWKLIPIKAVNGKAIPAFIFRTKQNCHGDKIVEVIAHKIDLPDGLAIEIIVSDEK